jgi:hypothetical protein
MGSTDRKNERRVQINRDSKEETTRRKKQRKEGKQKERNS